MQTAFQSRPRSEPRLAHAAPLADELLVARFVAGDSSAFDELIARYQKPVYLVCYRYFRNSADAEDAAQETFVRLLRGVSAFRGDGEFWAWLKRIAVNACHDLARRRSRRREHGHGGLASEHPLGLHAASAEETLIDQHLSAALRSGLDRLSEGARAALILHDVYGLAHTEIAQRTGVAVGTVKSRIHRGHALLATLLSAA